VSQRVGSDASDDSKVADEFRTAARRGFFAGAVVPTTKAITMAGGGTFDELLDAYYAQGKGPVQGDVNLLLVETCKTASARAAF
jgi:5-methyltetrahydrofolate--homocysteine methyltransferase